MSLYGDNYGDYADNVFFQLGLSRPRSFWIYFLFYSSG